MQISEQALDHCFLNKERPHNSLMIGINTEMRAMLIVYAVIAAVDTRHSIHSGIDCADRLELPWRVR